MSKCCVHASVGKPRGAKSRDAISHVRGFTWHLLRCHMTVVWLDEQQMSPSDTMPADSIGCIVNQSGLARASHIFYGLNCTATYYFGRPVEGEWFARYGSYLLDWLWLVWFYVFLIPYQSREYISHATENCSSGYVAVFFT